MDSWRGVQTIYGILSLGWFGAGYLVHSDPCLAFEHEYMEGGENCGDRKFVGSLAAFGVWALCFFVMRSCKRVEDCAKRGLVFGNGLKKFFCRLIVECLYIVAIIFSSALATEMSGPVTKTEGGDPVKYEQWASICSIISLLLMMLALRTADHYGMFDIVESTFLSILLALGKSNLVSLATAAAICCSYRFVVFFFREIRRYCSGNVDSIERLIDTAKVCVHRSRRYLNDLEANLPENDQEQGPIMRHLWNLRWWLNQLEDAIPLQGVVTGTPCIIIIINSRY